MNQISQISFLLGQWIRGTSWQRQAKMFTVCDVEQCSL